VFVWVYVCGAAGFVGFGVMVNVCAMIRGEDNISGRVKITVQCSS